MANLAKSRKNKYHLVYKTTNLINNKIYIGAHSTNHIDDGYMGSGKMLQYAIKKYGVENFKREILYVCASPEEMFEKEKEIVTEEFISLPNVYNIVTGGFGGFNKGSRNLKHITNAETGEVIAVDKIKLNDFLDNGWMLGGVEPSNKGKIYVYKDDKRKAIDYSDTEFYLNNGWLRGYKESPTKGKIWIYNQKDNKYSLCSVDDLDIYLSNGWIKKKWSPSKCWINNGINNKRVNEVEIENFISNGWVTGRLSSKKSRVSQEKNMFEKITCPYCNKQGQKVSMSRWHFDKCKNKS